MCVQPKLGPPRDHLPLIGVNAPQLCQALQHLIHALRHLLSIAVSKTIARPKRTYKTNFRV